MFVTALKRSGMSSVQCHWASRTLADNETSQERVTQSLGMDPVNKELVFPAVEAEYLARIEWQRALSRKGQRLQRADLSV